METADGAFYPAEACDVSEGGMALRSDFLLPPSLVCRVTARGAGDDGFTHEATVLHMHDLPDGDFFLGLAFNPTPAPALRPDAGARAAS